MTSYTAVVICGAVIGCIGTIAGMTLIFISVKAKDRIIKSIFTWEIYDVNHEVEEWTLKQSELEGGENVFGLDDWVKQLRNKKINKIRSAIGEYVLAKMEPR